MSRFDTEERGRGTVYSAFPHSRSVNPKEKVFIYREEETASPPVPRPLSSLDLDGELTAFLAKRPAMTVRDYKGKGFGAHAPFDRTFAFTGEKPWHALDPRDVREAATSEKARFLPRSYRQAAARDDALEWDEERRAYRLKGSPEGEGA
jgi:hypothetical protein